MCDHSLNQTDLFCITKNKLADRQINWPYQHLIRASLIYYIYLPFRHSAFNSLVEPHIENVKKAWWCNTKRKCIPRWNMCGSSSELFREYVSFTLRYLYLESSSILKWLWPSLIPIVSLLQWMFHIFKLLCLFIFVTVIKYEHDHEHTFFGWNQWPFVYLVI